MRRKSARRRCWKRKETRMVMRMMSMAGVRRKLRSRRSMMIPVMLNLGLVFDVGGVRGQDVGLVVG